MPPKNIKLGVPSPPSRRDISIVPENDVGTDPSSLSPQDGVAESMYSGHEPNLVPASQEIIYLKPTARTVNDRRYLRIPGRNVKACIKTEHGTNVVVTLINISRGGVCFTSDMEFHAGTQVSIATHFIEGGYNIFQDGRVVRVRKGPATLPGEYAVEWLPTK